MAYTLEKDSEFAIDSFDILDSERKLGLSGHMRVKNEAHTLRLSIESCIGALDELILVVQPSDDDSVSICKEMASRYEDKIRLFVYTPTVLAPSSSHVKPDAVGQAILDRFGGVVPDNSVHSFSHYSNFGLIKASYKYYVKLDADQIYFTDKLRAVRDSLVAADRFFCKRRNMFHRILGYVFDPFCNYLSSKLSIKAFMTLSVLLNGRACFALGGINVSILRPQEGRPPPPCSLLHLKDSIFVPLRDQAADAYNGSDLVIIAPDSRNVYHTSAHPRLPIGEEAIISEGHRYIMSLGIFWIHYGLIKRDLYVTGTQGEDYISLGDYMNLDVAEAMNLVKIRSNLPAEVRHKTSNIKYHFIKDAAHMRQALDFISSRS